MVPLFSQSLVQYDSLENNKNKNLIKLQTHNLVKNLK